MPSRELVVAIFADAGPFEKGMMDAAKATKVLTYNVEDMAAKNVAAMSAQLAKLKELQAEYMRMGAAAQKGSGEAIAAGRLLDATNRKLGVTTQTTTKLVDNLARQSVMLGRTMSMYVTAPLVAAGAAATKMFIDFQSQMTRIHTQAGASMLEVQKQSKNLIQYAASGQSPVSPKDLAAGLFFTESRGLRGNKALEVTKMAAQAAGMGVAPMEDVSNALGGVVVTAIKGGKTFAQTMGVINATVGQGAMHMADYAAALRTGVVPAAASAHITLQELGAALDVLTDRGMPAQMAATRLRMTFAMMQKPTKAAADALADLGIKSDQMAKLLRSGPQGFLQALELLQAGRDRLEKMGQGTRAEGDILQAFGKGRSSAGILTLLDSLSSKTSSYQMKLQQIGQQEGSFMQALAAYHQTAQYKISAAWNSIRAHMINAGGAIAPTVTKIVQDVAKLVGWFSKLPGPVKDMMGYLALAAAAAGPLLFVGGRLIQSFMGVGRAVVTMATLFTGASTTMEAEATATGAVIDSALITTGIGAIVVAIGLMTAYTITHWQQVKTWISEFGAWIKAHAYILFALPVIGQIAFMATEVVKHWQDIKNFVAGVGTFFTTVFDHPIKAIEDAFTNMADWIKKQVGGVLAAIGNILLSIPSWLPGAGKFHKWGNELKNEFGNIGTNAGQAFVNAVNQSIQQASTMAGTVGLKGPNGQPITGTGASSVVMSGKLVNPVTGSFERVDQGVDFMATKLVRAVGDGVITSITKGMAGGTGDIIKEKLFKPININGRKYTGVYYSEETPLVKQGQRVSAGMNVMGSGGNELGFLDASGHMAPLVGGLGAGTQPTQMGSDFLALLHALGNSHAAVPVTANNNPMTGALDPKLAAAKAAKAADAAAKKAGNAAATGIIKMITEVVNAARAAVSAARSEKDKAKVVSALRAEVKTLHDEIVRVGADIASTKNPYEKKRLEAELASLTDAYTKASGQLRGAIKSQKDAVTTAVNKLKLAAVKKESTTYEADFSSFKTKIDEIQKISQIKIPGVTTDYVKEMAKQLSTEADDIRREINHVRSQIAGATGPAKAKLQSLLSRLIGEQNDVYGAIEQNLTDAVSQMQTAFDTASNSFANIYSSVVTDITTAFQNQTQYFISSVLGPKFFQNGLLTPAEQALRQMQAQQRAQALSQELGGAQTQYLQDVSQGADLQTIQTDLQRIQSAKDAIKEEELQTQATIERTAADQAYAAAVEFYTQERTAQEHDLQYQTQQLLMGIQQGTASFSDFNGILRTYGLLVDNTNTQQQQESQQLSAINAVLAQYGVHLTGFDQTVQTGTMTVDDLNSFMNKFGITVDGSGNLVSAFGTTVTMGDLSLTGLAGKWVDGITSMGLLNTSIKTGQESISTLSTLFSNYNDLLKYGSFATQILYKQDYPKASSAFTALTTASTNLRDAFNALIVWVNAHAGTNISTVAAPSGGTSSGTDSGIAGLPIGGSVTTAYQTLLAAGYDTQTAAYLAKGISIPLYAAGGVVTGPQLAMVGEAGPEAIIPLDRLGAAGGGGVQINIYTNSIIGTGLEQAARELMPPIRAELQRLQRNNGVLGPV